MEKIKKQKSKIGGAGGARDGAGRPPIENPKKSRTIRTTDLQWEAFKNQGGNGWLCVVLDSFKKDK